MINIVKDICFPIQNLIFLNNNSDSNIPTISLTKLSYYCCNKKLCFFNCNLKSSIIAYRL